MRKRTLFIALTVLVAAGLAAGAFAATQSEGNPQQAFINDVAGRLHVSPAQLRSAFRQAMIDRINAAVRAGRLSPEMAAAIKQRIERGGGLPLGPGPDRFGAPARWHHPSFFFGPGLITHAGIAGRAASYLGLTDQQLMKQLASGRSLAQIARAQGKSVAGLEQALIASARSSLDQAVRAGRLPHALEQHLLRALSQHIRMIVTLKAPPDELPPGPHEHWMHPGGPFPFHGRAGFVPPAALYGSAPPAAVGIAY
jgi:hypothetical protein